MTIKKTALYTKVLMISLICLFSTACKSNNGSTTNQNDSSTQTEESDTQNPQNQNEADEEAEHQDTDSTVIIQDGGTLEIIIPDDMDTGGE